ncbi:MAG: TIR domain-containing protein [Actinomycetota bacterium]|nr:TIR domain-containing protein [Actinomycetota bacterium]
MSPLPPSEDATDGSRDLVFVSYSHADAEWVQRLEVLLKPVVRARRLRVWADSHIRIGNDWHRDITAAIERTRVALLLVSGDFLASDFIMDEELPALIAREVLLAPVLVGDCLWKQVPELACVQWVHGPGREGALQLVADRPGERDRRLTAVCERLIALVPEDAGAHPTGPPVVVPALPVEAVTTGPKLGPLLPDPHLTVRLGLTPPATALRRVLRGHLGWVSAVAWSPGGTRLATAGHDGKCGCPPCTKRRPSLPTKEWGGPPRLHDVVTLAMGSPIHFTVVKWDRAREPCRSLSMSPFGDTPARLRRRPPRPP